MQVDISIPSDMTLTQLRRALEVLREYGVAEAQVDRAVIKWTVQLDELDGTPNASDMEVPSELRNLITVPFREAGVPMPNREALDSVIVGLLHASDAYSEVSERMTRDFCLQLPSLIAPIPF